MKTYKLPPEAVNKYSKPRITLYIVAAVILFVYLLLFLWVESLIGYTRLLSLIVGILLWGYCIYWVTKLALTQRRIWSSYELKLDIDSI